MESMKITHVQSWVQLPNSYKGLSDFRCESIRIDDALVTDIFTVAQYSRDAGSRLELDYISASILYEELGRWIRSVEVSSDTVESESPDLK